MIILNRLVMCMDTVAALPHAHIDSLQVYAEHCVLKAV